MTQASLQEKHYTVFQLLCSDSIIWWHRVSISNHNSVLCQRDKVWQVSVCLKLVGSSWLACLRLLSWQSQTHGSLNCCLKCLFSALRTWSHVYFKALSSFMSAQWSMTCKCGFGIGWILEIILSEIVVSGFLNLLSLMYVI